jgi:hypothetical protein
LILHVIHTYYSPADPDFAGASPEGIAFIDKETACKIRRGQQFIVNSRDTSSGEWQDVMRHWNSVSTNPTQA